MSLRAVLVLSAALMAIDAAHWPATACLALPLLALALADRARHPGPWLVAAAAWTPFLAPLSGLDLAQVAANSALLLDGLRAWDGGAAPVALARGAWTGWIVAALVSWRLLIETGVALAVALGGTAVVRVAL